MTVDPQSERLPEARPDVVPLAPSRFRDVASDLQFAAQAVRYLDVTGVRADVSTTLQLAVVVTGTSPAEALHAAAAFARESPTAEVHSIAWARLPGPVIGSVEFRATLIVSYPDSHGEFTGSTDHARRH